jgi:rhodanese-related sulfurtransferase
MAKATIKLNAQDPVILFCATMGIEASMALILKRAGFLDS